MIWPSLTKNVPGAVLTRAHPVGSWRLKNGLNPSSASPAAGAVEARASTRTPSTGARFMAVASHRQPRLRGLSRGAGLRPAVDGGYRRGNQYRPQPRLRGFSVGWLQP